MSQLGSIRIGPAPSARRQFSIRVKIVALLLAPIIPLLVMTLFTVSFTLGPARNLRNAQTSVNAAGVPAGVVVGALQQERALSVVYVSTLVRDPRIATQVTIARSATDTAVADFVKSVTNPTFVRVESALTKTNVTALQLSLSSLALDRRAIDATVTRVQVMTYYDDIIDNALGVYGSITNLDDHTLTREVSTLVGLVGASEMLAREDALLSGAVAAGQMTSHDYTQLVEAIATQRRLFSDATRYLSATDQAAYQNILTSPAYKGLRNMENALIAAPNIGRVPAVDPTLWRDDYSSAATSLGLFEAADATRTINAIGVAATSRTVRLVLATGSCLVMLIILVFVRSGSPGR